MKARIPIIVTLLFALSTMHTLALDDVIRFRITDAQNGESDEAVLRFLPNATVNFDGNYDAYKLFSFNNAMPALFSKSAEGTDLAINAYPDLSRDYELTLYTRTLNGGNFILSYELLGAFDPSTFIAVRTNVDGVYYNLADFPLSIDLPASTDTVASFTVIFSLPPVLISAQPVCSGASTGNITLADVGNSGFHFEVVDTNGVTLVSDSALADSVNISGLSEGDYLIVTNTAAGESHSIEAQVAAHQEAEVTLRTQLSSCEEASNGSVEVFVKGVGPFDFSWSHDSANTNHLHDLRSGRYVVTVTDGNGCMYERTTVVDARTPQIALPVLLADEAELVPGNLLSFTNESQSADSSWWVFSDRRLVDGHTVQRSFARTGYYYAVVFAVAGECSAADTITFTIADPVLGLVGNLNQAEPVQLMATPQGIQLACSQGFGDSELSIFDLQGRLLFQKQLPLLSAGTQIIPVSNLSASNYIVRFESDGMQHTQQLFLH